MRLRRVLPFFLFFGLLIVSCNGGEPRGREDSAVDDDTEMGGAFTGDRPHELFMDLALTEREREGFQRLLRATGRGSKGNKRALYEEYIDVIGANGILEGIEGLWPKCHSEAHALGQVIHARVEDIGLGLRICADGCYSGCMHGVLMEAFAAAKDPDDPEGHIDVGRVEALMNELCSKETTMTSSYSPGDCAHGIGHALMVLADYDVPEGVALCGGFNADSMDYYCATGAYMEYVTEHDKTDAKDSNTSIFYPCDRGEYPAACARYKAVHVIRRHYGRKGTTEELLEECRKLEGKYRLGCFHGLGNAHMSRILKGRVSLEDLCLSESTEEEQFVCIEGAMERMAKYHELKAQKICRKLQGRPKEICLTAAARGMYNMDKDFRLYLAD